MVGRLPRRHRKTPSSGSDAAPVISRKPRHFACIIHSNSSGIPPARRRISHRDRKERRTRSFRSLVLFLRERLLRQSQSSKPLLPNVIIGMSLVREDCVFDICETLLTIYLEFLRTRFTLMPALIYIVLTFAERSFYSHVAVLFLLGNAEEIPLFVLSLPITFTQNTFLYTNY